jgi:hypothetical protein
MTILPDFRFSSHEVWVTLVLFFCLLLFVYVRITNPKKIPSLIPAFFSGSATEEKTITPDSVALFFVFICSVTLLVMQAFRFHNVQTRLTHFEQFLVIGLVLFAYYILKTIALYICGVIFRVQADARDYISEIYASSHLAAIGLLPAIIVLTFVNNINEDIFEKVILALIALLFLYRTIKMFILMMNRGLSVIYLFLYLCALEIIPLVLLFEYRKAINL